MNRYNLGPPDDSEFEPDSGGKVFRNRLGITRVEDIERVEARLLVIAQARSFAIIETDARLTVDLICDLHRSWLAPLYDFAGKIRNVDLAKDNVRFAPAAYLEGSLKELDRVLEEFTPCDQMNLEDLVFAIARVHTELVLVHPFREGNGRVSRWVADLMALQAGFPPLRWEFADEPEARRTAYFSALRRGFAMDFSPLEFLVRQALLSQKDSDEGQTP